MSSEWSLRDFTLYDDGSAAATFGPSPDSQQHLTLALNPNATAYTVSLHDETHLQTDDLHAASATPQKWHHLTATAVAGDRKQLAAAMYLRNLLASDAMPLLYPSLLLPRAALHGRYQPAAAGVGSVLWAADAAAAGAHTLRHADGSVRVVSVDRLAWLLLHPDAHSLAVCFPAPLLADGVACQGPASAADGLGYVFVTRLHCAAAVPECWRHAAGLALEALGSRAAEPLLVSAPGGWGDVSLQLLAATAAAAATTGAGAPRFYSCAAAPLPAGCAELLDGGAPMLPTRPLRIALPAARAGAAAQLDKPTSVVTATSAPAISAAAATAVLTRHSLCQLLPAVAAGASSLVAMTVVRAPSALVMGEDAPGAVCSHTPAPAAEVQLRLNAEESLWRVLGAPLGGRTDRVLALAVGAAAPTVYAADAIPPTLRCAALWGVDMDESAAKLSRAAALARSLVGAMCRGRRPASAAAAATTARASPADASRVVEEVYAAGLGRFRLFADGRVSAALSDRTVLTLARPMSAAALALASWHADALGPGAQAAVSRVRGGGLGTCADDEGDGEWMLCHAVLPDGTSCTVRSDAAEGLEAHVTAACSFAEWAALRPRERAAAERARLEGREWGVHEVRKNERALMATYRGPPHASAADAAPPLDETQMRNLGKPPPTTTIPSGCAQQAAAAAYGGINNALSELARIEKFLSSYGGN